MRRASRLAASGSMKDIVRSRLNVWKRNRELELGWKSGDAKVNVYTNGFHEDSFIVHILKRPSGEPDILKHFNTRSRALDFAKDYMVKH